MRIINGIPANLGEFPWQAQLITFWVDGDTHLCGGTLISSKHVLTAAHCFVNWITNMAIPKEEIKVITGRLSIYDYEPQQVTSKVAKIIIHPDYSGPFTLNNDIALLELVEPVQFNRNIKMACLGTEDSSNGKVAISGWGIGSGSNLNWTYLQLMSRDRCREILAEVPSPKVTEKMVCARDNDYLSTGCLYDSGG